MTATPPPPSPSRSTASSAAPRRRRRDRRGRGLRGALAPRGVPLAGSSGDAFDLMVLSAVEHLRPQLQAQLDEIEFAIEDVPAAVETDQSGLDDDVLDDNQVPLSRIYRTGLPGISGPVIVIYRRPLETRAPQAEDLADLVHDVVVEQVARLLGRSAEEIDPPLD